MTQIVGFICEINEETFKVYAFKEGLFDVPIGEDEPELARWVLVFDAKGSDYEIIPDFEIPYFSFHEKDGVVHGNILAICPCEYALPQEIGDKFANKVWNPFLGYLNDDEDVFKSQVSGGEPAEIIVRYAPNEEHLFEVMELVIWDKDPDESKMAYMYMTPWTTEFMCTHMKPAWEMFEEEYVSTNRTKIVGKDQQTIGVCIKHNHPNPKYDPTAEGSTKTCAILWSQQFGLTRWLNETSTRSENKISTGEVSQIRDPINKLGKWYLYALNDRRLSDKSHKRPPRNDDEISWLATTARQLIEAPMPMPTRAVGEEVEISCDFPFSHEMFESEENSKLEDWNIRRQGLLKSAHFADVNLGKVEINPEVAEMIIKVVEAYQEDLKKTNPDKHSRLKNEVIIIAGRACVLEEFLDNFEQYPKRGLFSLEHFDSVFYLQGGKVIWTAPDEKRLTSQ